MKARPLPQHPDPTAYAQRLVLAVLVAAEAKGERLTSRQIMERTGSTPTKFRTPAGVEVLQAFQVSDVRRVLTSLRRRGFEIADEWETNTMGKGYKRYWLVEGKEAENEQR